jgi:serine/threonine protein kinase
MLVGVLKGAYRIEEVLSPGPAFVTARATRVADGSACVLKQAARKADVAMTQQLAREAEILHALRGRGAPLLVDRGEGFLVMHHVALPPLAAMGRAASPPWPRIARAAMAALAAVHEADDDAGALLVVHADVAPSNVLVAGDGSAAFLADFGLARWRGGGPPEDGAFRGSLSYAAPEVARGARPTQRSDLFALAAAILHACTGIEPRAARTAAARLAEAAEQPMRTYDDAALPFSPGAAADALRACLAFDPAARPARARDVLVVMPLA